ncbi:MAG: SDR family oxidoreductase [Pseudomonadota bacterium]
MTIFIFGAGFTSRAYLRHLNGRQTVYGTTRSRDKAGALEALGSRPVIFDGQSLTADAAHAMSRTKALIISISPGEADPVLAAIEKTGGLSAVCPRVEWIGYLSTVGVYGDHDGKWVDETTQCKPVSARSHERLAAEAAWRGAADARGVPLGIFRLSGIYGPGRNTFVNFDKGRARRLVKPDQVFNRIHADDIATALELARAERADGLFNITDDMPAPPQDVVTQAAKIMGIEPPAEIDFATADLTPMARSFYGENKRVSNAKAKAELGWQPRFPTYEVALEHLWRTGWRDEVKTLIT